MHDLAEAFRALRRAPLVSVLIVATLGLGIGMGTAIFSVVNAVLLRPLEYRDPDRLVHVRGRLMTDRVEDALLPGGVFTALGEGSTRLEGLAGVASIRQNLTGTELPVQVQVGWISTNLFRLLGVRPALGRDFAADEPAGRLILSHEFWTRAFGADGAAVGRSVTLDGRPYEIVGVMPAGFRLRLPRFPTDVDVWKAPDEWWQNGDVWSRKDMSAGILHLVGRLAPGATLAAAQSEMDALGMRLREANAELQRAGFAVALDPLHGAVVGKVSAQLWLLFGAAGCVLLIACANVTNLLLARGQRRAREIAVRLALGGARWRIARLLVLEALVLSLLGAVLAVALGAHGLRVLRALQPANLPRADAIALDATVLGFALVAAFVCTLLSGIAPALTATRRDLTADLHGGRATPSPHGHGLRAALVVAQIALSLVLLVGGGLLAASLLRLQAVSPGFDPDRLLTFSVALPGARYERPLQTDRFLRQLEQAVESLPGVESAGSVWPLPLAGVRWSDQYVAGAVDAGRRAYAELRLVTPDLFETLRTPILEGHSFAPSDPRHSVIVSRRLAERAWPGQSAVGRSVLASPWGGAPQAFQVVGVVEDVRFQALREAPGETLYFDSHGWSWTDWEIDVVVRAAGDPRALIAPIRSELARLDALVPMAQVRPMREYLAADLAANRFALVLMGAFAGVALILALVGLYGVVACVVAERTREIGIRLAFGATRARIVALVVGQGARVAFAGALVGFAGAVASARLLSSLLYGVAPSDPLVLGGVASGMMLVALLASYLPARRAAGLDPVRTLRAE
jgi:putative ABC transport system permease protein